MACRGQIGELRQILRIGDIGRGIRLSAFEALALIRLAACRAHATTSGATPSKQMTRHTKHAPWRGLAKFVRKKERKVECVLLARWRAGRRDSRS